MPTGSLDNQVTTLIYKADVLEWYFTAILNREDFTCFIANVKLYTDLLLGALGQELGIILLNCGILKVTYPFP